MYYPKNKIEPNLYSNGNFAFASTNKIYHGYYFRTSDGGFFTGREPNDGPNEPLQPIAKSGALDESPTYPGIIDYRFNPKNRNYSILTNQPRDYTPITPIPYTPTPTNVDYQTGEFTRYFVKKRNENVYYEVEDERLADVPMYFTFNLQWVISGEESQVKITNQKMVELYMSQSPIPAFNIFLKNNYLKFWKPS
jgi:hypothetical protein